MNFGLGLAAADSYLNARKESEDRAYLQKQRDYQTQVMQAGLDTLPDLTASNRARYKLSAAESEAGLGTLDAETLLKKKQLQRDQIGLDFELSQQPGLQKIEAAGNKIRGALADQSLALLPQSLAQRAATGAVSMVQAQTSALAALGDAIQTGQPGIAAQYVQSAFDSGLFPQYKGKKVGNVGVRKDGAGQKVFVAQDPDGQSLFEISAGDLERVRSAQGKTELKAVKPGETLVGIKGGKAVPLFTSPESVKGANQHTPAEVQTAEWLIKNGVARNANEAWEKVRSARDKSETGFITDMMAKHKYASPEEITDLERTYRAMYRRIHASDPGLDSASGSNTPGVPTIDSRVKELLGIP